MSSLLRVFFVAKQGVADNALPNEAITKPFNQPVAFILLSGVLNQASLFYYLNFTLWGNRCQAKIYPVNYPLRDKTFDQIPDAKLGKRPIWLDIIYCIKRIRKIISSLPKGTKVILIGHSLGGLIALIVSAFVRGIDGVVAMNSALPKSLKKINLNALITFCGILTQLKSRKIWQRQAWEVAVKRSFWATCWGVFDPRMKLSHMKMAYQCLVHDSGLRFLSLAFHPPRLPADKIKCRVLIIGGKKDRIIPIGQLKKLAASISGSDFVSEPVYHYPFYGPCGEHYLSQIFNWLRSNLNL